MSARRVAVPRLTHAEPVTAARQRRDGSPYPQPQTGFSLGEEPGTRRRLLIWRCLRDSDHPVSTPPTSLAGFDPSTYGRF